MYILSDSAGYCSRTWLCNEGRDRRLEFYPAVMQSLHTCPLQSSERFSITLWKQICTMTQVRVAILTPFPCLPWASLVAQTVKCLPAMQEPRVQFLGREDPLEKEMAIHSSTLAWKSPWMEEPDRLQSMGSQRVGCNRATSLSLSLSSGLAKEEIRI